MMKAQSAIELLFILGIGLAIVFAIYNVAYAMSKDDISLKKTEIAVDILQNAIEEVYALNPGSAKYVEIELPGNLINAEVRNHTIYYSISLSSGNTDVVRKVTPKVSGDLPLSEGKHKLLISYVGGELVQIS